MGLQVQHLTRIFDSNNGVSNVSFDVASGEIVGLLGRSGSGKSTILRTIAGLDTDYQGKILIHGEEVRGPHKEIGVVFQEPRLFPWLTVLENVLFGLPDRSSDESKNIAHHFLQQVGLTEAKDLYTKQLSGGMAQRVAIARSLAASPGLLLMDEPFSALDAFTRMQLQDLVLDIWRKENVTSVVVTHDIDEALYLCDRIILLSGKPGQVYQEITIEEPHPRNRGSEHLAHLKTIILESLGLQPQYT